MNPDNNKIGLSRRKVLVGLGAVGVASAGAGLGTTAYFSDEESFTQNEIAAGLFELDVTQSTNFVDQDGIGPDEMNFNAIGGADEPAELNDGFLNITDAKPGDSYEYCWDICVNHNPGFVEITLDSEEWAGNDSANPVIGGTFDPNAPVADASGVLGDYMLAVVTLDDQQAGDDVDTVFSGTLAELIAQFENGGLVHAWQDEESTTYCHLPCESDVEDADLSPDSDGVQLCVYLYLPSHADRGETVTVAGVDFEINADGEEDSSKFDSPGNLVQGAVFRSDVDFAAEQCRHNDEPFGGQYGTVANMPRVPELVEDLDPQ